MAVVSPNIGAQETEADRQRRLEDERLRQVRDSDLTRIFGQFGDLKDLALIMEQMRSGADADTLKNAGLVANADQSLRYGDQDRSEFENRLVQVLADRQAAQTRADTAAKAGRIDDAYAGVNSTYGQYDDNFYNDYAGKIVNGQLPSLQAEFKEARRVGKAQLSDSGMRRSSAANRFLSKVAGAQAGAEGDLASNASNQAQTLRGSIEARRASALQTALLAAGLQQNVPVAGGSLADILKALTPTTPPGGLIPSVGGTKGIPTTSTGQVVPGSFTTPGGTKVTVNVDPRHPPAPPPVDPADPSVIGAAGPSGHSDQAPPAAPVDPANDPAYQTYLQTFQQNYDPYGLGEFNAQQPMSPQDWARTQTPAAPAGAGGLPVDSLGTTLVQPGTATPAVDPDYQAYLSQYWQNFNPFDPSGGGSYQAPMTQDDFSKTKPPAPTPVTPAPSLGNLYPKQASKPLPSIAQSGDQPMAGLKPPGDDGQAGTDPLMAGGDSLATIGMPSPTPAAARANMSAAPMALPKSPLYDPRMMSPDPLGLAASGLQF